MGEGSGEIRGLRKARGVVSQVSERLDGILGLWNLAAYPVFIAGLAALSRAIFLGRNVESRGASAQTAVSGLESGISVVRG